MINILITSTTGFIGKNLLEYFNGLPSINVFALNRSTLDLRLSNDLVAYVKQYKIDFIINTAVSLNDFSNNMLITYSLFNASKYCSAVLMLGSGIEYNPKRYIPKMKEDYFDKSAFPSDDNAYHNSKFLSSILLDTLMYKNVFNFRLFGVFGKYEDYSRRLISNNIFQYLTKGTLSYNKDISFDYLDVMDLARSLHCFITKFTVPRHHTYNICTGIPSKFSSIMNEIAKFYGADQSIIMRHDPTASNYEYSGNPSRFEDEFNIKILDTSFQQSIESIHNWMIANDEIKSLIP